jgi:Tol biopolymer transport system component
MAPGRTDDIWIRHAGAPARDTSEIRLTDFGWECGWQTWSRDGKRLVFISWDKSSGKPGISHPYTIAIDPATGRALETGRLPLPESMTNTPWAAWSPANGDVGVIQSLDEGKEALWVVPASGGAPRKLVDFESTTDLGIAGWTPDGKALVYAAKSGSTMQLFWISADGGEPRQLTHDSDNILQPAVSPDGKLVAATRLVRHEEIWRLPLRSVARFNSASHNVRPRTDPRVSTRSGS